MQEKNYCFVRAEKIQSLGAMQERYDHDYRVRDVPNADPDKADENIFYRDTNGLSYCDMFNDEIAQRKREGSLQRVNKNLGIDVVMRMSSGEGIDKAAWLEESAKWLDEFFNPPGHKATYIDPATGKTVTSDTNNVKSVVYHGDEQTPHIHAFVVPINDKGQHSYDYFLGRTSRFYAMQDTYAKRMEALGLERGVRKSIATPEQMRRYYSMLTDAVDAKLPEPLPGESVHDYKERAEVVLQTEKAQHRNDNVKNFQRYNEALAAGRTERDKYHEKLEKLDERSVQMERLTKELDVPELGFSEIREVKQIVDEKATMEAAFENYPNRALADETLRNWQTIMDAERRSREHKKHLEEKRKELLSGERKKIK